MSLTRKSCLFEEVPEWIYSCQCDKAKSDLFQATGQSVHMTYEGTVLKLSVQFFLASAGCFNAIIILN